MTLPRVAAITMSYNEGLFAPLWARHYAAQVGAAHCYLVDHGSDDGSTDALGGVNVLRIPRSPQDDVRRARFVSGLCASLLEWYDAVIHTDVDELLLADPALAASLPEYAAGMTAPAEHAVGLDLHHLPGEERRFDPSRPIGVQRRWVRFASSMCKAVIIRRPVRWAPGFHCADVPVVFGGLYLVHLRYLDLRHGLQRLAKTRSMPWVAAEAGAHQRVSGLDWARMVGRIARLPRQEGVTLSPGLPPLRPWLDRLRESMAGREAETYRFDLHISGDSLWELPAAMRAAL